MIKPSVTRFAGYVNRQPRQLTYLTCRDHRYTARPMAHFLASQGVGMNVRSYEWVWQRRSLPVSTYIFTDFDRLSPTELEVAGVLYDQLAAGGSTVLNDPRQFRTRPQLQSHLRKAGLPGLPCWSPAADDWPNDYPVFLRTVAAHRGVLSKKLHTEQQAKAAVAHAVQAGHPICDLMLMKFAAEKVPGEGFRKFAAFRIGKHIVRANTVTAKGWVAKRGKIGLSSAAFYAQELAETQSYPRADFAADVFDKAGYDFGRIDYGIINGQPVIYELNSNPMLRFKIQHPNPDRAASLRLIRTLLCDAFAEIAAPRNRGRIRLSQDHLPRRYIVLRRPRRF